MFRAGWPFSAVFALSIATVSCAMWTDSTVARQRGLPLYGPNVPSRPNGAQVHALSREQAGQGIGLMWRQPTSLPEGRMRAAVAVGRDGRIYVFGGESTSSPASVTNSTFIYDPRHNTWQMGLSMPTAREGAQAVTLSDGRIAVLGGGTGCSTNACESGTVYNSVEVYIPSQNVWTALPPMETPRYRFAAVLGKDGRVYVIGGSDGHSATATAEAYNPRNGRWSYIISLPRPEESASAIVAKSGKIYLMGGLESDGQTIDSTVFVWNGTDWVSGLPMPQSTQDGAITLGADGNIYVIGGWNQSYLATVQRYDPSTATWNFEASLLSGHAGAQAVTLPSGQIYCVGGSGTSSPSDQVSVYGPSISLSAVQAHGGSKITVTGDGFAANALVRLYWGDPKAKVLLGSGHTDDTGTLLHPIHITIPRHSHVGHYRMVALDERSHYPSSATFSVVS